MGFQYQDLARKTKPAELDLGEGDVIHFRFRHQLLTPKLVGDMMTLVDLSEHRAEAGAARAAILAISEHVARLVSEWDVMEGDTMFPLVAERLAADIPLAVQRGLLMTCIAEMQVGEAPAPAA